MSKIREELLKEWEEIRRTLNRRHERKEITDEDLKKGTDALDKLKELV